MSKLDVTESRKSRSVTITLSATESLLWYEDGPEASQHRESVRFLARLETREGRSVEIVDNDGIVVEAFAGEVQS